VLQSAAVYCSVCFSLEVRVCCSVLQCGVERCTSFLCASVCFSVLQGCSVLRFVAVCCSVLQRMIRSGGESVLQCGDRRCSVLQCDAERCSVLQCVAVYCRV